MPAEPLAITGFGLISAAGIDDDDKLAELLRAGGTALARRARIQRPEPRWTGSVPDRLELRMDPLADGVGQRLCVDWAVRAGRTALARAGIDGPGRPRAATLGLVLASNLEDHPRSLVELAVEIADALGVQGPRLVTSMACASSLAALSLARLMLTDAEADAVLVIGADVLTPRVVAAFDQLSLVCEQPCSPFSLRVGLSLGEGAAALVIERVSSTDAGAERIVASVLGEGLAADAHHPTTPEPNGAGTHAAVRAALSQAQLEPGELQLILAHGTGTTLNDAAELCGFERAGLSPTDTPIVALKSVFGHAQGAAGAVELAAMLVAWERGITPVSAGFEAARVGLSWPVSRADHPRGPVPERVVLNSAGFGGAGAAVIVGRGRVSLREAAIEARPPIYLQRWATAGWAPEDRAINWRRAVRGVDLRAVDPSTRLLTLAVDRALPRVRDPDTGLFVGQARSSVAAGARLRDEIQRHGLEHTAASALAEPLTIMPAGGCARIIGLRGPFGLCVAEGGALMQALCWGADRLQRRRACPGVVAAVLDERTEAGPDGAAAVVLGREGPLRLAGWAMLGAGRGDQALARACERAGLAPGRLAGIHRVGPDTSPVAAGANAILRVCASLEPDASAAVIVDEPGRAAIAIVLTRD